MSISKGAGQDPRISRTKRILSAAMLQLLEQTGFSKITVNDICSAATVSRTTFYQHFEDKYELLRFCLELAAGELQERTGDDLQAAVLDVLEFVKDRRRLLRNLLASGANEELLRMLSDLSVSRLRQDLERVADGSGGVPAELAAVFLSGGMAALLVWWLGTGFAMPAEQLTEHLLAMLRPQGAAKAPLP